MARAASPTEEAASSAVTRVETAAALKAAFD